MITTRGPADDGGPPDPTRAAREGVVDDSGAGISRWTVAAIGTRTAAKWMIGSLAAAAALIFGAGPIVNRPELSWGKDSCQLSIALAVGTLGLVCLIALIGQIAKVLTPVKVSLESIPEPMRRELDASAAIRLPSGSASYAEFLRKYREYKIVVARVSARLATFDDRDSQSSNQRQQLRTLLDQAQGNVAVYTRAAEGFLNQAEFYTVSQLFDRRRGCALALAVGAAVGALGFQLALASGPKDLPKAPQLAYLNSPAGPNELWNALKLADCAVGTRVPVMLSQGKGTDADPYVVTVVKVNDRCEAKTFDLQGDALVLEKAAPEVVDIHYKPHP